MKTQIQLLPLIAAAIVLPTAAFAQITIIDFGESNSYVTANQTLGGNGSFSTSNISPASNYSGPTFWGGARYGAASGMDTWAVMDNWIDTGNFDAIRGRVGSAAADIPGTYVAMFSASATFSVDNTANSSFFLKGRRTGGQDVTGVTGVRWLLRDTEGNYYVSALNETTASRFSSTYANNTGVTGSTLVDLGWFNYTFTSGAIGTAVADQTTFFSSTEFNAAGFNYVAQRNADGAIDMSFADFNVVAIPEPSSFAALAGLVGIGLAVSRRRRRAS